jgi:glucose-6-phosphate isomerase
MTNKLYRQHIEASLPKNDYYQQALERTTAIVAELRNQKASHRLPLLDFPEKTADLAPLQQLAQQIAAKFSTLVVLGTGGSSLNGRTMAALHSTFGSRIALHFMDNIDPVTFTSLLAHLDYQTTGFLCISKSGNTVETLSQTVICINASREVIGAEHLGEHFFFISDPVDNPMRRIAATINATMLDHDDVGGRFSALTNVGLLPAMIAGLSGKAFRSGAASVMDDLLEAPHCEAAKGAALAYSLMQSGYHTTVMMPYIDRLADFASWFRQLWAESLGKNGQGSTPIRALGTVDQHSQLQLYLDGPRTKSFTFITLDSRHNGAVIDTSITGDAALAYVHGKTLGDLITAEQQATMHTLINHGSPVRNFSIETLDETVLGALMMHFMLETIITAALLGINPFDQPAVEAGKILTRKLLAEEMVS